jgi:centrosomal protein CEP104
VGIIAVNLIGEVLPPVPSGPPGYLEVAQAPASKQPYYNKAAAAVADLNLDLHVDQHTAAKIRDLQRQKEAAIEAEDYDEAKRLKVRGTAGRRPPRT